MTYRTSVFSLFQLIGQLGENGALAPKLVALDSKNASDTVFAKFTTAGSLGHHWLSRNTTPAKETAMRAGLVTTSHAVPMVS